MDTRQLETLLAISQHGGFAAAAQAVNLTASAVSQQIAALASARHIALDNDSLYQLRTSTEGWISGVLLALSASARQANADDDTTRYLNESVLDGLTPRLRHFLQQTSIVSAFSPALAAHLSGDAQSSRTLAQLGQSA